MNFSDIAEQIRNENCDIILNESMSKHTSFKVGGNADMLVYPKTTQALIDVVKKLTMQCNFCVIGNGSNLLIADEGISGAVIKTTAMEPEISLNETTIRCSAGTALSKLCITAMENSLTGIEFAYGIPGTVGGAIFMNAGAYGGEIKDVLVNVTHINTSTGITEIIPADKLDLSYRHSFYSANNNYIILSAEFKLKNGVQSEIKTKMNDLMSKRKEKQPLDFPSAGSTFKRPEGFFAGALIEECGLKGFSIGGAQVSEKHAGFIINKNKATAADIKNLINEVIKTVKEKTGVTLETEVKIIP